MTHILRKRGISGRGNPLPGRLGEEGLAWLPRYPVVQTGEVLPELLAVPGFRSPWVLAIEVGGKLELGLAVLALQLFALVAVTYYRRCVGGGWRSSADALFTQLLTQAAIGYLGVVQVRELLLVGVSVPSQRLGAMGAERLELLIADAPQRHQEMHIDGFDPRPGADSPILLRLILLMDIDSASHLQTPDSPPETLYRQAGGLINHPGDGGDLDHGTMDKAPVRQGRTDPQAGKISAREDCLHDQTLSLARFRAVLAWFAGELVDLAAQVGQGGQQRWLGVIVTHLVNQGLDKVRQWLPGLRLIELMPGR